MAICPSHRQGEAMRRLADRVHPPQCRGLSRGCAAVTACLLVFLPVCRAAAHPVLGDHHDRTLQVTVRPDHAAGKVVVTIAYRLELNEFTAFRDMQPFSEKVPPGWQKTDPDRFYDG